MNQIFYYIKILINLQIASHKEITACSDNQLIAHLIEGLSSLIYQIFASNSVTLQSLEQLTKVKAIVESSVSRSFSLQTSTETKHQLISSLSVALKDSRCSQLQ